MMTGTMGVEWCFNEAEVRRKVRSGRRETKRVGDKERRRERERWKEKNDGTGRKTLR